MPLLSQVRVQFMEEHRRLRAHVRALRAELADPARVAHAQRDGLAFLDALLDHLGREDDVLLPALKDADAWGTERAHAMQEEHVAQRADVSRLRALLDGPPLDAAVLQRHLETFMAALEKDMDAEDADRLDPNVLRDDPVTITQSDG